MTRNVVWLEPMQKRTRLPYSHSMVPGGFEVMS
jgi:hypothetical protein